MRSRTLLVGLTWGLVLGASGPARAADTVETYEKGVSDLELYAGYHGVGQRVSEHALLGDFLLGIGIVDRLSMYIGTTVRGYERMRAGDANVNVGLFGTVLDTRHVDLDLLIGFGFGGPGFRGFTLTPGFELNLDRKPDLAAYGLYLRGAVVLSLEGAAPDSSTASFVHHYVATLGAYVTVARNHQLLLEIDAAYHPRRLAGERAMDLGGLALGYNVSVHHRVELIHQVFVDLPLAGEQAAIGFLAGLIVTLPTPRK